MLRSRFRHIQDGRFIYREEHPLAPNAKHLAAIHDFGLGEGHQFVEDSAIDPCLQPWADGDLGAGFAADGVQMHADWVFRIGGHHFIQIGADTQALARCAITAVTIAPE